MQTATPGYLRNFRDLNDQVSRGKSFSGYERNSLFLNRSGEGFTDVGSILGVDFDDDARAVAVVDWDRDGDLDMWVANRSAPQLRLLLNHQPDQNASSIGILLEGNGTSSNRDAIGARLKLSLGADGSSAQMRSLRAGDGFLSQSSRWIHFGVGMDSHQAFQLEVGWPDGNRKVYDGLRSGGRYTIKQGQGVVGDGRLNGEPFSLATLASSDDDVAPQRNGFWVANQVPFPELTYTDSSGQEQTTTQFLGKPVLINLWATWCAPCLVELKELGGHATDLESLGATVLALNVDGLSVDGGLESKTPPARVLTRAGYTMPHGVARQENLGKIEILIEYLSSRRASLSVPTSILVDAKGNTAAVYSKAVHWEQLRADIESLESSAELTLERATPRPGRWFANPRQVNVDSYLGDYATLFGINGFPEESQRLYELARPEGQALTAQEYFNRAKSAAEQGKGAQAIEFYQKALELDPQYGRALTGLGAMYLRQKRVDEAEPLFQRAIQIDPNHATALINLAMIEQMRGDLESAVARLRKVVALNPGYHEAQLSLGSALAGMQRHDEAIVHLSKALELKPTSVVGQLNLAKLHGVVGNSEAAEKGYRTVMQLDPKMAYPHFGVGNLQAARGDHPSAIESFEKAISLGANNAATYTRLGQSLGLVGKTEEGIAALKRALELNPQYARAIAALRELASDSR